MKTKPKRTKNMDMKDHIEFLAAEQNQFMDDFKSHLETPAMKEWLESVAARK